MRLPRQLRQLGSRSRGYLLTTAILSVAAATAGAVIVEALARPWLDGEHLSTPTRFYGRPLLIQVGETVEREVVEARLKRLGYTQTRSYRVTTGQYSLGSREWTIGRRAFRIADKLDPGGVSTVRVGSGGYVSSIRDADGRRQQYLTLEPELLHTAYGSSNEDRIPISLADVPAHLVDAVLSIEDQRFFDHSGIDVKRIVGAAIANVRARRVLQGGSTITQQLVKNLYLSSRRSPVRKLREIAMAAVLEDRYEKAEILEAYLNQVYLGQDGALAIHGMGRAAQFYFGRDVSQLDVVESALLAGIIRGPSLYSPFRNPERATGRRNLVLSVMSELGLLTERELRTAQDSPLDLRRQPERTNIGRYAADFVAAQIRAERGASELDKGLTVFTTVDLDVQRAAEQAVRTGLAGLEREYPRIANQDSRLQAALVALNPSTGEILAMVGGRDYGETQYNRAVYAHRQPGSSFKPIVALTALTSSREQFTLASHLDDERLSLETPAGLWEPDNYDGRFRGSVSLRDALERSLNVPFARLGLAVGPDRIAETGLNLGIESRLYAVPSLALGSSDVTPLEMTRAYGVLAAGGFRADLHVTLGILDREGEVLSQARLTGEQVYDPDETYLVTSALRGAVERGTGRRLRSLGFRGPVAAKSGTTNGFRDAWFIGYTPELAVGVWVGFDDGRSIGLSGSRAALPIFARFLVAALGRYGGEDFTMPYGVEVVEVDQKTGLLAGPGCRGQREVFISGTAPERSCSPYWRPTRRYASDRNRWYEPLMDEVRRRLGGGR
jgi:penicillin-binding protein 1B